MSVKTNRNRSGNQLPLPDSRHPSPEQQASNPSRVQSQTKSNRVSLNEHARSRDPSIRNDREDGYSIKPTSKQASGNRSKPGSIKQLQTSDLREKSRQKTAGGLAQSRNSNVVVYNHSTHGSQVPTRQGSQRGSVRRSQMNTADRPPTLQEVDEDDDEYYDSEFDDDENYEYVDYYPDYAEMTPIPVMRTELADGPEPCSCFPKRSSKHKPSMLYEKITCKHTGLRGQNHPGVSHFDFNWSEKYEDPVRRKKSKPPPKISFAMGYPNPKFVNQPESDENDEDDDIADDGDYDKRAPEVGEYPDDDDENYSYKMHANEHFDDYDSELDDDDNSQYKKAKTGKRALLPTLPQIGYSPPASRGVSRRSQVSLPSLPESPYLSVNKSQRGYSGKSIQSRQSWQSYDENKPFRFKGKIDTSKRFTGKYYDQG